MTRARLTPSALSEYWSADIGTHAGTIESRDGEIVAVRFDGVEGVQRLDRKWLEVDAAPPPP